MGDWGRSRSAASPASLLSMDIETFGNTNNGDSYVAVDDEDVEAEKEDGAQAEKEDGAHKKEEDMNRVREHGDSAAVGYPPPDPRRLSTLERFQTIIVGL